MTFHNTSPRSCISTTQSYPFGAMLRNNETFEMSNKSKEDDCFAHADQEAMLFKHIHDACNLLQNVPKLLCTVDFLSKHKIVSARNQVLHQPLLGEQ